MKKDHRQEYDVLRVYGTILVVLGHSAYTTMITPTGGVEFDIDYAPIQTIILLLVRLIYSFHMPMFVALSGALFYLTRAHEESFLVLIKKKSIRLLIPFVLVSLFWSIPLKAVSGYWEKSSNPFQDILLGQFICFDNNYLWYVISLFWIFCCFWLLSRITKNHYVLVIICFLCFAIAQFMPFNYFGIQKALSHMIWFETGIIYEKNRQTISQSMNRTKVQLLFAVITILVYITYIIFFKNNVYAHSIIGFFGLVMMYVLYWHTPDALINSRMFAVVLKKSFQIYLLSDPLNYLLLSIIKKGNLSWIYGNNWFCIGIFVFRFIITIGISLLVCAAIEKIKKRCRYAK